MRLQRRAPIVRGLAVATAATVLALLATADAEAQRRGGFSAGSFSTQRSMQMRTTSMPRYSTVRPAAKLSVANTSRYTPKNSNRYGTKLNPKLGSKSSTTVPGKDGGRKPPKYPKDPPKGPVVVDKPPETGKPPRWPGRDPRRPPGIGVIGPAIGTGILIGPLGPAGAAPIGPPPPPQFGGPAGPAGPARPLGPIAGINIPPPNEQRFVPNEVVLEFAGNFPPQAMTALARRHRLARLDSVTLQTTGTTFFRGRIVDGRPVRAVLLGLQRETVLRAGQPNYIYTASQQTDGAALPAPPPAFVPPTPVLPSATPVAAAAGALPALGGDPAQYALAKLRLQEAHSLTKGSNILVAVIDSGVDASHPELRGVIASMFDALGKVEKPHMHGTAIAGAIAARSRLMGVAPAARILAIRAFGAAGNSAEATTFAIIKGIDHATIQNARVINMSFNGPADPGIARQLAAARARGIVLVAAVGNLGENSPPQYPAADPNVIAVSATDAEDNLFRASNRGRHVAVAAPGVDILVPVPNANYEVTSGTSFAAAHVSGIVALILERQPGLGPEAIRKILLATARDLGPAGMDEQFGAGLADAYQAILALEPRSAPNPEAAAR